MVVVVVVGTSDGICECLAHSSLSPCVAQLPTYLSIYLSIYQSINLTLFNDVEMMVVGVGVSCVVLWCGVVDVVGSWYK